MSKDFVAINISNNDTSYPPSAKLYCNLCSCNLVLSDPQKEEWWCNRCIIAYYPNKGEKVKRANRFETPGPMTDSNGNITGDRMHLVSMVDDNPKRLKRTLPRSMDMLKRPGVNMTEFHSSVESEGID